MTDAELLWGVLVVVALAAFGWLVLCLLGDDDGPPEDLD